MHILMSLKGVTQVQEKEQLVLSPFRPLSVGLPAAHALYTRKILTQRHHEGSELMDSCCSCPLTALGICDSQVNLAIAIRITKIMMPKYPKIDSRLPKQNYQQNSRAHASRKRNSLEHAWWSRTTTRNHRGHLLAPSPHRKKRKQP